jgi:hypothetical protein
MRQPGRPEAPRERESGTGPVASSRTSKPAPPPPPAANKFEPLPLGPAAFAPPMYSNSTEEEPSRVRKLMPLFVVLGAASAGALAIGVAVLINRPAPPERAASSTGESTAAAQPKAPSAEAKKTALVVAAPAVPKSAPPAAAAEPAAPAGGPVAAAPAPAAAAPEQTPEKAGAEASAPLSKAEEEARAKRHAARAAKTVAANLPSAPSRTDVLGAMSRVAPAVQRCMSGTHGIVTADMKIEGATGRVMSANVSGAPGSAGSCIAGAVRKARFPPFSQASISVRYPMKL